MGPTPGDDRGSGHAYAFSDGAVASRRLARLAAVFEPATRALFADLAPGPRPVVVDLGCGPGHTTRLLAELLPGSVVTGLDASEAFLAEAAAVPGRRWRFARADVTGPLPGDRADLVYARFLLVHLPEPEEAVARWADHLAPGGLLVVEEADAIETDDPDFSRYLELAAVAVADAGGDLGAGRLLREMAAAPDRTVVWQRRRALEVTAGAAATLFSLNLSVFGSSPAVAAVAAPGELAALAGRLAARTAEDDTAVIGWTMGQLVLGRPVVAPTAEVTAPPP